MKEGSLEYVQLRLLSLIESNGIESVLPIKQPNPLNAQLEERRILEISAVLSKRQKVLKDEVIKNVSPSAIAELEDMAHTYRELLDKSICLVGHLGLEAVADLTHHLRECAFEVTYTLYLADYHRKHGQ